MSIDYRPRSADVQDQTFVVPVHREVTLSKSERVRHRLHTDLASPVDDGRVTTI